MTTPEHSIAALCQRSRDISLEKGWLNPDGTDPRPFHTVIALFHSELSEAFEEVRNHKPLSEIYYEVKIKEDGQIDVRKNVSVASLPELKNLDAKYGRGREFLDAKPAGIPIELADFVIRVCQWAGSNARGAELQALFDGQAAQASLFDAVGETAEEVLADLHLAVSQAYEAERVPGESSPLEYLAGGLHAAFALCRKNDVDLWAAIDEKEAYNRTRPTRHGNKAC